MATFEPAETDSPASSAEARAAAPRLPVSRRTGPLAPPQLPQPWRLPERGLALYHGPGETARLSHYFLPRLLGAGKNVLILDGANSADPRLIERLARERGVEFGEFSRHIRIARAFTCFQLTELVARVPRFLDDFPAQVLVVTALPDLYFDEDIRDGDARAAFERALGDLRSWAGRHSGATPLPLSRRRGDSRIAPKEPLAIAIFSSAADFSPSPARRHFFARVVAAATEVWEFRLDENGKTQLVPAEARPRIIGGGMRVLGTR